MSEGMKSFSFAVAMCVVCSVLLTLGATGLQPLQDRNMLLDRHKNILLAAGLLEEDVSYTSDEVNDIYTGSITSHRVGSDGTIRAEGGQVPGDLPLYLCYLDDELSAYIIPFTSRGLWGEIYGYLALDTDGATVKGFSVYQHQETPGLGGEIEKRWFRKNFSGKKIVDRGGDFVSVAIAKGRAEDTVPETRQPNYVDGISGATLTGKFLSEGLKDILLDYEPVSVQFRQDQVAGLPDEEEK
jgi:Na+-transporting NADH:ubiquinone oxidoreductase subunit C